MGVKGLIYKGIRNVWDFSYSSLIHKIKFLSNQMTKVRKCNGASELHFLCTDASKTWIKCTGIYLYRTFDIAPNPINFMLCRNMQLFYRTQKMSTAHFLLSSMPIYSNCSNCRFILRVNEFICGDSQHHTLHMHKEHG